MKSRRPAEPRGVPAKIVVMPSLAEIYDVALVDLDGVIYRGADRVPHASTSLARARAAGMHCAFVTNNAARTPQAVADQLTALGVPATAADVVTSAQAAAHLLAEQLPPGAKVLVVGGDGLVAALTERGLTPVFGADEAPAAVVSGLHPDVGWRLLAEGCYAVTTGVPWVATNVDPTLPTARGLAPGNGALVAAIQMATARQPVVAGKPEPPLHQEAILRTGARRPLVVGDRLDTDIAGARRAGADSLLVLTGVTGALGLVTANPEYRPTFLAMDLRGLGSAAADLSVKPGRTSSGRYTAAVERDRLVVSDRGERGVGGSDHDAVDLLRATCGAVWAAADRGQQVTGIARVLATAGWPVPPEPPDSY
jgi:glycerol-1-phosphatase